MLRRVLKGSVLVPDLTVLSEDVDVILRRGFELMYLDTRLLFTIETQATFYYTQKITYPFVKTSMKMTRVTVDISAREYTQTSA
jgi:hypothetical protein